jgi:hypothetical protein
MEGQLDLKGFQSENVYPARQDAVIYSTVKGNDDFAL